VVAVTARISLHGTLHSFIIRLIHRHRLGVGFEENINGFLGFEKGHWEAIGNENGFSINGHWEALFHKSLPIGNEYWANFRLANGNMMKNHDKPYEKSYETMGVLSVDDPNHF
jgi:hypothetical protein